MKVTNENKNRKTKQTNNDSKRQTETLYKCMEKHAQLGMRRLSSSIN